MLWIEVFCPGTEAGSLQNCDANWPPLLVAHSFEPMSTNIYEEVLCAAVKSAEPLAKEQLAKAEEFTKAFKDNLSKEMEQVMKNNQKPGGGFTPPRN